MDTSMKQGPPKYLQPQDESKYYSQYDDEEGDESEYYEGEESESEYDSDFTKTEDHRSNSSLSNYQVPDENHPRAQYLANTKAGIHAQYTENYGNYQHAPQSRLNHSEKNPQMMSSIGSDGSGIPPQYHPPMHKEAPKNYHNPYQGSY